ncbi:MAG: hypothetical protein WC784_02830 [Candidatus Shapirobacteria bacterium]|jgi:hypothetical protein
MDSNTLTDFEIKDITNKLAKLSPHGFIPYDLFVEFTRLKVHTPKVCQSL